MERAPRLRDLACRLPPTSPESDRLLAEYTALVLEESRRQNLIAASTSSQFRSRHQDDSLQLHSLLRPGSILDIGSGAGLPGLPLACLGTHHVHLVEPRARRAEFLQAAVAALGLDALVQVHSSSVQAIEDLVADNLIARAVTRLTNLFAMAIHLARPTSRWVLPKGRSAHTELEAARETWHGDFELIPSVTDPSAFIIVAENVRRRRA